MTLEREKIRQIFVLLMVFVAGCVDAIGFTSTAIFPANMTGNAVLIAASLVGTSPLGGVEKPALVLLSFCCGSLLGSLMIESRLLHRAKSINLVILLAGFSLIAAALTFPAAPAPFSTAHLLVISIAMGLQSAAALAMNVTGAGITTVITSTLITGISKITAFVCSLFSKEKSPPSISTLFPLFVFGTYFTGAIIGVFHWGASMRLMILLAGLILVGVATTSLIISRSSLESE